MIGSAPIEAMEALLSLVEPAEIPVVDDAALMQLALGIADPSTRVACAKAILADPDVRKRFMEIRKGLMTELGPREEASEVAAMVGQAESIQRILAEGRWRDGTTKLQARLPEFRLAWNLASKSGDHHSVEAFVRALLQPLVEMTEWEAVEDLAQVGHQAVDTLGNKLRRYLLAYEGVAASKRGDWPAAVRLWSERLRIAREDGNRPVEADALIDLAAQAIHDGDLDRCRELIPEAQGALEGQDRVDLEAGLDIVRSAERRLEGDLWKAADHARKALSRVSIRMGADPSAFVRIHAGEALSACGQRREAIDLWTDALGIAIDAGLSAHASESLRMLAEALEHEEAPTLAMACVDVAWAIDAEKGTPRSAKSGQLRSELRMRHPHIEPWHIDGEEWLVPATSILDTLRDGLRAPMISI